MTCLFKDVAKYRLIQYAIYSTNPALLATLFCMDDKDAQVAEISFYQSDKVEKSRIDGDRLKICFGIERFEEVIQTFRYETPIYLGIKTDNSGNVLDAHISTGTEPAGEQEGV